MNKLLLTPLFHKETFLPQLFFTMDYLLKCLKAKALHKTIIIETYGNGLSYGVIGELQK